MPLNYTKPRTNLINLAGIRHYIEQVVLVAYTVRYVVVYITLAVRTSFPTVRPRTPHRLTTRFRCVATPPGTRERVRCGLAGTRQAPVGTGTAVTGQGRRREGRAAFAAAASLTKKTGPQRVVGGQQTDGLCDGARRSGRPSRLPHEHTTNVGSAYRKICAQHHQIGSPAG